MRKTRFTGASTVNRRPNEVEYTSCKQVMNAAQVNNALMRLSYEILEKNPDDHGFCIVGIESESSAVALRLHENISRIIGSPVCFGRVNLDSRTISADGSSKVDLNGKNIILASDVLYTGSTIRLAMDVLCEFCTPASIQLAALIDRGHRKFPIRANYTGKNIPTAQNEFIEVIAVDGDDRAGVYIHSMK